MHFCTCHIIKAVRSHVKLLGDQIKWKKICRIWYVKLGVVVVPDPGGMASSISYRASGMHACVVVFQIPACSGVMKCQKQLHFGFLKITDSKWWIMRNYMKCKYTITSVQINTDLRMISIRHAGFILHIVWFADRRTAIWNEYNI